MRSWTTCWMIQPCWRILTFSTKMMWQGRSCFTTRYVTADIRVMNYQWYSYQPEEPEDDEEEDKKNAARKTRLNRNITVMAKKDETKKPAKKILFSTDGAQEGLTGLCSYFLRLTTRRTLGEETFQVLSNTLVLSYYISSSFCSETSWLASSMPMLLKTFFGILRGQCPMCSSLCWMPTVWGTRAQTSWWSKWRKSFCPVSGHLQGNIG